MRFATRLSVAATMVLAGGCGSTVSGHGAEAPGADGSGGGLSVPGTTSSAAPGVAGQPGSQDGPSAGGSQVNQPTALGGAPPAVGARSGTTTIAATGRGYDAQHVYLGFPTNNDVNTAAPSGIGATNFGDQPSIIKAVVADINRHGGILGRTVVPLMHDIATADLETDAASQAQNTCSAFTQDAHVVAVINIVAAIDLPTFYACLAKHDTPLMSAGFIPADDTMFRGYAPYLYKLAAASFSRLTPVWLARLTAMGYFHSWDTTAGGPGTAQTKVGLLFPAQQPQQRIFADIGRRLAAAGYPVTTYQYDASNLNNESASMSNAVLQMRNAGVTHILSSESDVLLFMTAADSQHYRPRYGLTSYHAPAVQLQGTVPATQLTGSMGVGWLPVSDVDSGHSPGPTSSGETSCRALMHGAGQDTSTASVAIVAFAICDAVRLTSAAVNGSNDPSSAGLRAGLDGLGGAFASALTWRAGLAGGRYSLPGAVRDFRYDGSAYTYVSKTQYPL